MELTVVALHEKEASERLFDTSRLASGYVVLRPGEVTPRHTTGRAEEVLVILEGSPTVVIEGRAHRLENQGGLVLYIPPHTPHEIRNEGRTTLRYVYCVVRHDDPKSGMPRVGRSQGQRSRGLDKARKNRTLLGGGYT